MASSEKGVWGETDASDLSEEFDSNEDQDLVAAADLLPVEQVQPQHYGKGSGVFGPVNDGEKLVPGDLIRTSKEAATYVVQMVNESRAFCSLVPERGRFLPAPGTINISPRSAVIRVRIEDLRRQPQPETRSTQETAMATAEIPVASKSNREKEKERKERLSSRKSASPAKLVGAAAKSAARAKRVTKPTQTVRNCACGCGEETSSYFIPGHDARFKSFMVKVERGTMQVSELPKAVQKAYEFKKRGAGFVSTTNYKGEPHKGYDNKPAKA